MTATLGSQGAGSADTETTLPDPTSSTAPLLSDMATSSPVDPAPFTEGTLGRRVFAHIADVLIALMIVFGVAAVVGQSGDVSAVTGGEITTTSDYCDLAEQRSDVTACFGRGGWAAVFSATDLVIIGLAALAFWIFALVLLQGRTGSSPGKMLAGLKVIDREGNVCGTSRALTRSLFWIVDSLPLIVVGWVVPVVGIIAAMTNSGYRRVGDLVAGTWVIPAGRVDEVVAAASAGPTPTVDTAPILTATPEPEPQIQPEPRPLGRLARETLAEKPVLEPEPEPEPVSAFLPPSEPEPEPVSAFLPPSEPEPEPVSAFLPPSEPEPEIQPEPEPEIQPESAPRARAVVETEPAVHEPEAQNPPTYEPQWDPARNAYICWEPVRGQWLQHDAATGAWTPIG